MIYVVLVFKDQPPELVEDESGMSFQMKVLKKEKVTRIYVAKSHADAVVAMEAFGEGYCL